MAPSNWLAKARSSCLMQVAQRTSQRADNTVRMYKIHYYELSLNCSSVVRTEASLGVGAVVSAHVGGVGNTNTAVQVWHYHCFHLLVTPSNHSSKGDP